MGRSEDLNKLPRFDDAPESHQRPEIPPPPRMPSISPPEVGYRVAPPPLRGARPDAVPAAAQKKSVPPPVPKRAASAPPPPPAALSRSAPPPPAPRVHSAAPETEPIERIDLRSVFREPAAPPVEQLGFADVMDDIEVNQDAPTTLHRIPKPTDDQPSIAPVSMSSDELIEVSHIARNNRLARVGYAAVFGATLVAGLYVWRMQPHAAAQPSHAAAVPMPFFKEPARLIAATALPVIERTVEPASDSAATEARASAREAAANRPASTTKQRSSKTSKSEGASEREPSTQEEPATAPAAEPTQAAASEPAPAAETPAPPQEAAPELPPFNQAAAQAALDAAAGRAAGCLKEGEPSGMARVVVTFAPSGRVTTASVDGAPYAGTPTGGCIARAFRSAEIAPFSGKLMTVGKTVALR